MIIQLKAHKEAHHKKHENQLRSIHISRNQDLQLIKKHENQLRSIHI
jgi:transposase